MINTYKLDFDFDSGHKNLDMQVSRGSLIPPFIISLDSRTRQNQCYISCDSPTLLVQFLIIAFKHVGREQLFLTNYLLPIPSSLKRLRF